MAMPATLEHTLRAAAARLVHSGTPALDARVLARHALGLDDAGLIFDAKRELTPAEVAKLDTLVARRAAGEPVAYIIGEKEFRGLMFKMAPGVLVPRPDTETLIDAAEKRRPKHAPLRILDLGTGSGCLIVSLLAHFPNATGVGVDVNNVALALAARNAETHGVAQRSRLLNSDWGAGVDGPFDLIVSNPPYIRAGDRAGLPADVREHEDPRALFSGADGLDAYRAILADAPQLAAPASLILLELGEGHDAAVAALARAAFPDAEITADRDLSGRPRALAVDLARQKNI